MRLAPDRFRVVTGGATGMSDAKWIRDHLPPGAFLADLTSAWTTIGLWGPRARDVLAAVTDDDVSHQAFAFGTCREIELGGIVVLASRTPTWASSAGSCSADRAGRPAVGHAVGGRASRTA